MQQMSIGQLADAAGVNVETIRYYQRRKLLAQPERLSGAIGRYSPAALMRLRFIKRSQSLGFSLDDVRALLSLDDGQHCTAAKAIGELKLADVRQRIQTLQALDIALQHLIAQCSTAKRKVSCPLIGALMQSEEPASGTTRGALRRTAARGVTPVKRREDAESQAG